MEAKLLNKKTSAEKTLSKTLAPKLRFKGFKENWNLLRLGDLGSFKNGLNKDSSEFGYGSPFVNLMDVFGKTILMESNFGLVNATEKDIETYSLEKGDVLFIRSSVKRAGVGETIIVAKDLPRTVYSGFLIRFRDRNKELGLNFKSYCFSNAPFRKELLSYATSSANTNINQESLAKIKLHFPTIREQQKIGSFLSAVDEKILQLTRKTKLLEQYKKGVIQQLFSGKLMFKNENGKAFPKWEDRKLGDVLFEHKLNSTGKEDVYSVSVHKGLINQIEHLGRAFAAKNTDNYNLVNPNDIIYTKSPTGSFPLGIIKQSKVDKKVIVSPLYGVFTPETPGLGYILNVYFETPLNVKNYLSSIIQKGAKNTINITNTTFLSKKMKLPVSKVEQQKIGDLLLNIDFKIENVSNLITQAQTFKKGLLQQMFV